MLEIELFMVMILFLMMLSGALLFAIYPYLKKKLNYYWKIS